MHVTMYNSIAHIYRSRARTIQVNQKYLELFGFPNAPVRMDVGHVDGRVALVAPDAPTYPHSEAFAHVFLNSHRPLG